MNMNLWQSSVLLEIWRQGDESGPARSYWLPVPPQSVRVIEKQRIAAASTYGGIFADDYGPGAAEITLSGLSSFRALPARAGEGYGQVLSQSGMSAFEYLRDEICRYKRYGQEAEPGRYYLKFYDYTDNKNLQSRQERHGAGWICLWPHAFESSKSQSAPLQVSWTLSLIGVRPTDKPAKNSFGADFLNKLDSFDALVSKARTALADASDNLQAAGLYTQRIERSALGVLHALKELEQAMNQSVGALGQAAAFPLELASLFLAAARSFYTEVRCLPDKAASWGEKLQQGWLKIVLQAKTLFSAACALRAQEKALGQSSGAPQSFVFESASGSRQEIKTYGSFNLALTGHESIEDLAKKHYNDASLARLILRCNRIACKEDLPLGAKLKLPHLKAKESAGQEGVFSLEGQDPFGADIALSDTGGLAASGGDLALVEGGANVRQALLLRLKERIGRRARLQAYGLNAGSGQAYAGNRYIAQSIREALLKDPRVQSVAKARIESGPDSLSYRAQAVLRGGKEIMVQGALS